MEPTLYSSSSLFPLGLFEYWFLLNLLTVFRCSCFEDKYGKLRVDSPLKGLLARGVIVVDGAGKVVYEELVPEITTEPNYDAALAALK